MKQGRVNLISTLCITAAAILVSVSSYAAPLVDFRVTAGQWQADFSGEVGQDNQVATMDELGFDDEDNNVITFVLEHPVPFLPNVKIQHTGIDMSADGTLERALTFNDITYAVSEDTETDLDLTHTDFTLFYSPVNNWVHFDIGLTGRKFSGEVSITGSTTGEESEDLDVWLPMVYLGARFELPLTGVYIDSSLNAIGYDGNELTDFTAAIGYQSDGFAVDFIAELGYRTFSLEIDDVNDIEADFELDGIFLNVGIQL